MTAKPRIVVVGALGFLLGAALPGIVIWNPAGWSWADRLVGSSRQSPTGSVRAPAAEGRLWTCGMHPQVIRKEPGRCPICRIKLVPVKHTGAEMGPGDAPKGARKIKYWRAPMDPNHISDKPGKSPMGMDLIPVYEGEERVAGGIRVDRSFLQNFGVRTAVAEKGSIPVEIHTVGVLAHNEENVVSVNTKFEGWIERAEVHNIGERVHRGDPLFAIYSPQLVTTQKEYLAAKEYVARLRSSSYTDAIDRARSLLEATRERLRHWGVTDDQIAQLDQSGRVMRTVEVFSPASGHVAWKMGDSLEGMKLTSGMTVLKLADHSTLWAEVEFYEYQLRYLREGQRARIRVDAFPGRLWSGKIVLFNPRLDPRTRTLRAFIEVDNRDLKLRPQMFAHVLISLPAVSGAVKVPEEAILHSGERSVVIVQKAQGLFEPREVKLGANGAGYYEVRDGVQPGELVVTSSQFLIDSESNLKAAIRQLLSESVNEGAARTAEAEAAEIRQH